MEYESYFKQENNLIYQMRLSLALKQRKICLYEDVTVSSIFECEYYLHRIMDLDKKTGTKKSIEILVNTNGGIVDECLSLVSLIELMKDDGYEIITINTGKAYSAGFVIAMCGSVRKSYRHSRFMYHSLSAGTFGKLHDMIEAVNEFTLSNNELHEVITSYSNINEEQLNKWDKEKEDVFFNPLEMIEYKVIDEII